MTLSELRTELLKIDPALTSFEGDGQAEDYTIMTPHNEVSFVSDDVSEDRTIAVTIDRFSLDEDDQIPRQIIDILEEKRVPMDDPIRTFESDTKLHRWIIDCYVTA